MASIYSMKCDKDGRLWVVSSQAPDKYLIFDKNGIYLNRTKVFSKYKPWFFKNEKLISFDNDTGMLTIYDYETI